MPARSCDRQREDGARFSKPGSRPQEDAPAAGGRPPTRGVTVTVHLIVPPSRIGRLRRRTGARERTAAHAAGARTEAEGAGRGGGAIKGTVTVMPHFNQ